MSNMSLYIPRVFNNIHEARVANVFEKLGFGKVSKVDFVSKEKYKSAYVHFASWNDNDATQAFRKELEDNGKAKINYDDPWFWIVLEYKKKHVSTPENSPTLNAVPVAPKKQKALVRGVARRLNFDEEHVTTNLVDASYVRYLEQQNSYLYSVIQQQKNMNWVGPNQYYTWA